MQSCRNVILLIFENQKLISGQECVSVGCSVDLFLFNNAYIDIATLSQVPYLFQWRVVILKVRIKGLVFFSN